MFNIINYKSYKIKNYKKIINANLGLEQKNERQMHLKIFDIMMREAPCIVYLII